MSSHTSTRSISTDFVFHRTWHTIEALLDADDQGDFTVLNVYCEDSPVFDEVWIDGHVDQVALNAVAQDLMAGRSGEYGIAWTRQGRAA